MRYRLNCQDKKGFTIMRVILVPDWILEADIISVYRRLGLDVVNLLVIE